MNLNKKDARLIFVALLIVFTLVINELPINVIDVKAKTISGEAGNAVMKKPEGISGPADTAEPTASPEPTETPKPAEPAGPTNIPEPTETPTPTATPKPLSKLKKVSGVKLIRYSTDTVKITWKKSKKARYYNVYYSKKKSGSYRLAGVTPNTRFLVKKLKNNTKYYFYVRACRKKKAVPTDSDPSKKVCIKTKKYRRKIIFAGDSITEGIGYPGYSYPYMNLNCNKKTVAYRGLNTVTFHTKRIFNGKTGLQKLISENPYRVYMMLGLNEIHYKSVGDVISEYKEMILVIKQACPDTDIVICAVSPVTRAEKARCPGFWQIPLYNKKLKKLAKTTGSTYFDYTGFLKDSQGYLKSQYAAADGYHWKAPAYAKFGKEVGKFDKSLDK